MECGYEDWKIQNLGKIIKLLKKQFKTKTIQPIYVENNNSITFNITGEDIKTGERKQIS